MERKFIPYKGLELDKEQIADRSKAFYDIMDKRRSVRHFSSDDIPKSVIEDIIMTASSAPSGAHKQPWTFCAVSSNELKKKIREAAEKEEYENYHGRMSEEWLEDLHHLGTDWNKEFLEIAPWLIIVFKKVYDLDDGIKKKNYYVNESVGIASGFLLSAIHMAGLASLTHTPSPMNFLEKILERPENERAVLLIPVGYPAPNAEVPELTRKSSDEVIKYFD